MRGKIISISKISICCTDICTALSCVRTAACKLSPRDLDFAAIVHDRVFKGPAGDIQRPAIRNSAGIGTAGNIQRTAVNNRQLSTASTGDIHRAVVCERTRKAGIQHKINNFRSINFNIKTFAIRSKSFRNVFKNRDRIAVLDRILRFQFPNISSRKADDLFAAANLRKNEFHGIGCIFAFKTIPFRDRNAIPDRQFLRVCSASQRDRTDNVLYVGARTIECPVCD